MPNLRLRKVGGLSLNLPAASLSSIVGLANDPANPHPGEALALVRFDFGAGPSDAFVLDDPSAVFDQVATDRPDWVALTASSGDPVFVPAGAVIAFEGLDPAATGAAAVVHFNAGDRVRYVRTLEPADLVDKLVAGAKAPAEPPSPAKRRRPQRKGTSR